MQDQPTSSPSGAAPAHAVSNLKREGDRAVWLVQRPGQEPRTLKVWPLTAAMAVKLLLGIAQPQRQARGAGRLRRAGVPTPQPIGRWRLEGGRVVLESTFAPGHSGWQLLGRRAADPATAATVGRYVARIAAAGLLHRDLQPTNVIVDGPRVAIIDPVGVRRCRDRAAATAAMLERLGSRPTKPEDRPSPSVVLACVRAAVAPLDSRQRRRVFEQLRRMKKNAQ